MPIHAAQMMLLGQSVCIDYSQDLQKHKTDEQFLTNVLCTPSRLVETPSGILEVKAFSRHVAAQAVGNQMGGQQSGWANGQVVNQALLGDR